MSDELSGFIMTIEVAQEFFERCILKEAITKEERIKILKDLVKEKQAKELNNEEIKETIKDKKVLVVKNEKTQKHPH